MEVEVILLATMSINIGAKEMRLLYPFTNQRIGVSWYMILHKAAQGRRVHVPL
jgi:hypothetical protein